MDRCSECATILESWEVTCHNCGQVVSTAAVPIVPDVPPPVTDLEEAFQSWLNEGKTDLENGKYEEAAADFLEALKRLKALPDAEKKEPEVRHLLAQALEKSGKLVESVHHYELVCQSAPTSLLKEEARRKTGELKKLAAESVIVLTGDEEFAPVTQAEARVVPLYCSGCKRLLNEGQVFAFRKGRIQVASCFCGHEGRPLAKHDAIYRRAMKDAQSGESDKQKLLSAANRDFPSGRKKAIAIAAAIVLGNFGIHKFYLGERGACFIHILFCWTLVPWVVALWDAINYISMSRVSWNLTYNIDHVLAALPAQPELRSTYNEVFSMEISEERDDFEDMTPEARSP